MLLFVAHAAVWVLKISPSLESSLACEINPITRVETSLAHSNSTNVQPSLAASTTCKFQTAHVTCSRQGNNLFLCCLRAAPEIHLALISGFHCSLEKLTYILFWPSDPYRTRMSHRNVSWSGTVTWHGADADAQRSSNTHCRLVIKGQGERGREQKAVYRVETEKWKRLTISREKRFHEKYRKVTCSSGHLCLSADNIINRCTFISQLNISHSIKDQFKASEFVQNLLY